MRCPECNNDSLVPFGQGLMKNAETIEVPAGCGSCSAQIALTYSLHGFRRIKAEAEADRIGQLADEKVRDDARRGPD